MARAVADRLGDIARALDRIERRLQASGITTSGDLDDESLSIVAWSLLTAGEAIKTLPAELTGRHRNVDWRGLAGLRDQLAHQYFRIDQTTVWKIVTYDLAALRAAISAELRGQSGSSNPDA